jgi:hypothetical protein
MTSRVLQAQDTHGTHMPSHEDNSVVDCPEILAQPFGVLRPEAWPRMLATLEPAGDGPVPVPPGS